MKDDNQIQISFNTTLKIDEPYLLKDFFSFKKGMQPYEKGKGDPPHTREMMNKRIYHADNQVDSSYLKLLKAKNIKRYLVRGDSGYIKYGNNLAAPRTIDIFSGPRILLNRILSGDKIDGVYIKEQMINNSDVFNLIPNNSKINPKVYLPLIVSRLCASFFKLKNINLNRATYPKLNVNTFEQFPIPDLNLPTSKKLIEYSDKMLNINEEFHIHSMKFCELLSAKFNLEKLSRKLQSWYELTGKEFLKELNKNLNKENRSRRKDDHQELEKPTLSEQQEWLTYFQEEKEKAQILIMEIEKTDHEIDNMVYELYGLTDEEIALVEDS